MVSEGNRDVFQCVKNWCSENYQKIWEYSEISIETYRLKRSGRPKVSTTRTVRIIRRLAVSHPDWPVSRISNELAFMRPLSSRDTICRRLLVKFGLKSRIAAPKPVLSKKSIRDPKLFYETFKSWTTEMWSSVMFSNETIIKQSSKAVIWVRRPVGKRYCLKYVRPLVKIVYKWWFGVLSPLKDLLQYPLFLSAKPWTRKMPINLAGKTRRPQVHSC